MSKRKKCNTICEGCLSTDRYLAPIKKYYDLYLTLMGNTEQDKTMNNDVPSMCWECQASLRSIDKFRNKVHKAQSYLSGKVRKGQKQLSLTNLQVTINSDITEIKHEDREIITEVKVEVAYEEVKDDKPNLIEISIDSPDLKNDTDFDLDYTKIEDELKQEVDMLNVIKKENKKKVKKKIKKHKNHPKYKVVWMCDRLKPSYEKVAIDSTERTYWLEQERNYRNYKIMSHKCELCITGYPNEESYLRHIKLFHSETSGDYICDICKKRFKLKQLLQSHLKRHNIKYVCKICKYECYGKLWKMRQHFDFTHKRIVECLACGLHLTGLQVFYKHYKELHKTFTCDYCGKNFTTRRLITNHIRLRHNEHSCKECNKTYTTLHALVRHNNIHHVKSASELCYCVECNIQFDNVTTYTNHLKFSVKHRKLVTIPCPGCDKVYHKRHVMTNHYQHVHLKKTNHYCEPCDRYFLNGFRLRQHKASVHDKIPPVKNKICGFCGRGFSTNRILENHIRTHTGERPFACSHCTSTFSQQQAMISHMRTIHKVVNIK